ncbi:peroxiredoxin family protein [Chondrinema litorale]|uniref:peroxiredoxin family protein n=1 Tax=Chondrinema litorale TaxID=2994555 RepID=UPI00254345CE|nr:TlpA disulfide reductase family protein [Chondrinema litorale]UZR94219.1 TlpA disulfide reductase family protein [Chondrinema litorale]
MKLRLLNTILLGLLFLNACNNPQREEQTAQGITDLPDATWRAEMQPNDSTIIPFTLKTSHDEAGKLSIAVINGDEVLPLEEYRFEGDSIIIPMLSFDTDLRLKVEEDKLIGMYEKYWYEVPYEIPVTIFKDDDRRFIVNKPEPLGNVTGTWDVDFLNDSDTPEKAVGIFEQKGINVTGTFLTPTGDYRYLAGVMDGKSLKLSCFDGSHAFLFTAELGADNKLTNGTFYSGSHWYQPWVAVQDDNAKLPDAGSLTHLKEGYDKLTFRFPNLDSTLVSIEDEKYKDKVVIVQIMGSWCPNCMDETNFLTSLYEKYQGQGLEIIGLAYERKPDFAYAKAKVEKMKDKFGVDYEVLIAGTSDKKAAAETLPMLDHILSFPTAIVIDREGNVSYIHTGFSGPGTGKYYTQFVDEFTSIIDGLIKKDA